MKALFDIPTTRYILFTGKGGVGKTSLACATAVALADSGAPTLIVSTDPASNLDEVLGQNLSGAPTSIAEVPNLFGLNIDPQAAAARYRERAVDPYRKLLPEAAIRSMEESLSGACTVEIAAFDEFTTLLSDPAIAEGFQHIVFDTAPTGHTLRLLSLPAAWAGFAAENTSGTSCLGPLAALQKQATVYRASVEALQDGERTAIVLVARPDEASLKEADRASSELRDLGAVNQTLILNGVFAQPLLSDAVAVALADRQRFALEVIPTNLRFLPRSSVPLLSRSVSGLEGVRSLLADSEPPTELSHESPQVYEGLESIVDELAAGGRGVVMTMGKGGVGKTTVASAIAGELARRGLPTILTTTDPAAHVFDTAKGIAGLVVEAIDPKEEIKRYSDSVLATAGRDLDTEGRALLEEDLRSPCTEEIAVFRAFADTVSRGKDGFVVIDTAPTGHTILLLDAAEAYHREVARSTADIPPSVRDLLPLLRDPGFTRVIVIALPEPTPVHEAASLVGDLRRAGIEPFAAVVNQSLGASGTHDPFLMVKAALEERPISEARELASRFAVLPWTPSGVTIRSAVTK